MTDNKAILVHGVRLVVPTTVYEPTYCGKRTYLVGKSTSKLEDVTCPECLLAMANISEKVR